MIIKVLDSAITDLLAGRSFYESQGKVSENTSSIPSSDIDSLVIYFGIHPKVFGYYRLLSKRFPYAVYYTLEDDVALVWRVLDLR